MVSLLRWRGEVSGCPSHHHSFTLAAPALGVLFAPRGGAAVFPQHQWSLDPMPGARHIAVPNGRLFPPRPSGRTGMHDKILIVDFGSQVTQLIARRVREEKVYCEIVPFQKADAAFREMKPKAVIL